MNAIISLCHFCEFHGPKIIYCTQPFRPQEEKHVPDSAEEIDISEKSDSSSVSSSSHQSSDYHNTMSSFSSAKDNCEVRRQFILFIQIFR